MATPTIQTAPLVVEGAQTRAVSLRWIIGARDDLVWFIGSVASSYLLFGLYVSGLLPLFPMLLAIPGHGSNSFTASPSISTRKRGEASPAISR